MWDTGEKNSARQDQCCDGRSLGTVGVQRMDVPNLDLGVRENSLEQRASVLRPERGVRIIQEKWGGRAL